MPYKLFESVLYTRTAVTSYIFFLSLLLIVLWWNLVQSKKKGNTNNNTEVWLISSPSDSRFLFRYIFVLNLGYIWLTDTGLFGLVFILFSVYFDDSPITSRDWENTWNTVTGVTNVNQVDYLPQSKYKLHGMTNDKACG